MGFAQTFEEVTSAPVELDIRFYPTKRRVEVCIEIVFG